MEVNEESGPYHDGLYRIIAFESQLFSFHHCPPYQIKIALLKTMKKTSLPGEQCGEMRVKEESACVCVCAIKKETNYIGKQIQTSTRIVRIGHAFLSKLNNIDV